MVVADFDLAVMIPNSIFLNPQIVLCGTAHFTGQSRRNPPGACLQAVQDMQLNHVFTTTSCGR